MWLEVLHDWVCRCLFSLHTELLYNAKEILFGRKKNAFTKYSSLAAYYIHLQEQGKDPSVEITQEDVLESGDEQFDELPDTAPPIELPPCELSKLEEISELFRSVLPSPIRREKLSSAIERDSYIRKLVDLFQICEDLEKLDGLHHLYDTFKSMFLLNKNALFEIMFSEDLIFDVVGVLEYDPLLVQPAKHREFLRNSKRFKEVIPILNQDLLTKIHQTYRVQYIHDVILPTPTVFEENMLSALSSFIFFNKVEIVSTLQVSIRLAVVPCMHMNEWNVFVLVMNLSLTSACV